LRIDKFLWCIRLFKTRSLAAEALGAGLVKINQVDAKASRVVKVGDSIELRREGIRWTYEVLKLPVSRVSASLVPTLVADATEAAEREKHAMVQMMQKFQRSKGTGRPTKKERRDIERIDVQEEDATPESEAV